MAPIQFFWLKYIHSQGRVMTEIPSSTKHSLNVSTLGRALGLVPGTQFCCPDQGCQARPSAGVMRAVGCREAQGGMGSAQVSSGMDRKPGKLLLGEMRHGQNLEGQGEVGHGHGRDGHLERDQVDRTLSDA